MKFLDFFLLAIVFIIGMINLMHVIYLPVYFQLLVQLIIYMQVELIYRTKMGKVGMNRLNKNKISFLDLMDQK